MSIKLSSSATKAVQGLSAVNLVPGPRKQTNPEPVNYDAEMDNAIADMDKRGIDFMAVPAVKRHEAFIIESKLTKAANENRQDDFLRHLQAWRNCFH